MLLPPDHSLQEKYKRWSYYLQVVLILLPILVLLGWQFEIPVLRRMGSPVIGMAPITAVCLLLGAFSLLFIHSKPDKRSYQKTGLIFAVILLLISLNRFFGEFTGWDLPLDTLLYAEQMNILSAQKNSINRLSLNNSFCFLLIAISLVLAYKKTEKCYRIAQYLILMLGLISLMYLLSYLYQNPRFLGMMRIMPMALNSAAGFFIFSFAFFYAWPDRGLMRQITTRLSGSLTARVLLPAAILLPSFFGLLRLWGYWRGFYDNEFGVTILSLFTIITIIGIAWFTAVSLNKRELEQLRIRKQLVDRQQEINAIFQNAPDAVVILDSKGLVVKWNPEATRLFGWKEHEVVGGDLGDYIIPEELREKHRSSLANYNREGKKYNHR
ncbi:MAG: PAS domain-containing protein [Chitinophagaceae bacterium]|nr:PAS domain-containing protein [Chitinophagaceae bacterium]